MAAGFAAFALVEEAEEEEEVDVDVLAEEDIDVLEDDLDVVNDALVMEVIVEATVDDKLGDASFSRTSGSFSSSILDEDVE